MRSLFVVLFLLTGVFAILGGLYTWGDGSIFQQTELARVLIPWADIILTGPLSLFVALGLYKKKRWGLSLGLVTGGIYTFGSILVFISVVWNKDYSVYLLVPAFSGLCIGAGFIVWRLCTDTGV